MSFDSLYTRRHPRHHYSENIEFCLDYSSAGTRLHGISVNISDSGIGLYTFAPIYAGQTITFETTLPVPYQKAAVMWVQKRGEDLYKVGLNFKAAATEGATVLVKVRLDYPDKAKPCEQGAKSCEPARCGKERKRKLR